MDNNGNYRGSVGKLGENETVAYLMSHGHAVIERNWRTGHLEVDIISLDAAGIHFVEVKSRRSGVQVDPGERVGMDKIKRIAKAAARYMKLKNFTQDCHFDVATVVFNKYGSVVEFIPDAYLPLYV